MYPESLSKGDLMPKTYPITVRLTEEQKNFIDKKIENIKETIDIDVPAGVIIRKFIEKAMRIHTLKTARQGSEDISEIRHFMKKKLGNEYERRKENIEDLLKIIEDYKASEMME